MVLTNHCDIYAAVYEAGINRVVKHLMRQTPCLFNWGSSAMNRYPDSLCCKIDAAPEVIQANNQLIASLYQVGITMDGAPVDGVPVLFTKDTLNWCAQLAEVKIDFHPGNVFSLPADLNPPLASQRMAMYMHICAGLECRKEGGYNRGGGLALTCFPLSVYAIAECGVADTHQSLTFNVDDIEIEELKPEGLMAAIECYTLFTLREGILPMAASFLSEPFKEHTEGIAVIDLSAAPTVPNPAIEDDQFKFFINIDEVKLSPTFPSPDGGEPGGGTVTRISRPRIRTGLYDATAAVSEGAVRRIFAAAISGFKLAKSGGGSWGPFSATYSIAAHLEDGSVELRDNDDGEIRISELDIKWDQLLLNIGFDIPRVCVGGWCVVPIPFDGCLVRLPELCFFSENPDFTIPLNLGGLITSEISLNIKLQEFYGVGSGTWNRWQTVVVPILPIDLDIIDIADTVGDLFHRLVEGAINDLFGWAPQWAKDLLLALLGGIEEILRVVLDIPDDIGEWLLNFLDGLGIFDFVNDALFNFLANVIPPVFELPDPYEITQRNELVTEQLPQASSLISSLIPWKLPIEFIGIKVDDAELTLNVDMGD